MKPLYLLIVGVLIVIAGWWLFNSAPSSDNGSSAVGVVGEPRDIALDFYSEWLSAVKASTTDPYAEGLATAAFLEDTVKEYLASAQGAAVDPVLCQEATPGQIAVRELSITEDVAEFYVIGRGEEREKLAGQATVKLLRTDDAWTISEIACSFGESAPEREFSFEREGFLMKDSLPDTFDKSNWYLVFEQDGVPGYTVPLFFGDATNCGTEEQPVTCDQSRFIEATKASVKGQMTEAGLDVLWFEQIIE